MLAAIQNMGNEMKEEMKSMKMGMEEEMEVVKEEMKAAKEETRAKMESVFAERLRRVDWLEGRASRGSEGNCGAETTVQV